MFDFEIFTIYTTEFIRLESSKDAPINSLLESILGFRTYPKLGIASDFKNYFFTASFKSLSPCAESSKFLFTWDWETAAW